jgi:hypothetical protein
MKDNFVRCVWEPTKATLADPHRCHNCSFPFILKNLTFQLNNFPLLLESLYMQLDNLAHALRLEAILVTICWG